MSKMPYARNEESVPFKQNLGREDIKCLQCDKFLKRFNDDNEMEKRITVMLIAIKKELSELRMLFILIEKEQSIVYMLLIGIIVALDIVMVV